MGRVIKPSKFTNYIAPPVIGINSQPLDFDYVRSVCIWRPIYE